MSALRKARLTLDNEGRPFGGFMTSTYEVRRGGVGHARIELRFRIERDPSGGPPSVLSISGVLVERDRFAVLGGNSRDSQVRRDPQPIRAEDREAMAPIRELLRFLREAGAQNARQ